MGDARLDYNEIVYGFRSLERREQPRLASLPKVTYFTMGIKWQTADSRRRRTAGDVLFASGGRANCRAATARSPPLHLTRTSRT